MAAAAEQQADEVAALAAIFGEGEFDELTAEEEGDESALPGFDKSYRIHVRPEEDGEDPGDVPQRLGLVFAYPTEYPDEAPVLACQSIQGIAKADLKALEAHLAEEAQNNLGMAMMFTLATAAKEWLREHANLEVGEVEDPAAAAKRMAAEEERQAKARRAAGTPVTKESFEDWRTRFDAERALARALAPDAADRADRAKRMTGREYFEKRRGEAIEADLEEDEEDFDFDEEDDDLLDEMEELIDGGTAAATDIGEGEGATAS